MSNPLVRHTVETVREVAKQFATRSEFQKKAKGAYLAAYRFGYLDDVCEHMPAPRTAKCKPRIAWTLELATAAGAPYHDRASFQRGDSAAYQICRTRGWLDVVCAHMDAPQRRKWTKEEVIVVAAQCADRTEFITKHSGGYSHACHNGYIGEVDVLFPRKLRKLTDVQLQDIASRFATRKDFERGDASAYVMALNRGIMDSVCAHMSKAARNGPDDLVYVYEYQTEAAYYVGTSINPWSRRTWHLNKGSNTSDGVRELISDLHAPNILTWGDMPDFVIRPPETTETDPARIPRKLGVAVERHFIALNKDKALNRILRPKEAA
jgi:hypothetical protein